MTKSKLCDKLLKLGLVNDSTLSITETPGLENYTTKHALKLWQRINKVH